MGGQSTGWIALEAAERIFQRWLSTHNTTPFGPLFDLFDFTEALFAEEMLEIEPTARGQGTCCTMLSFKGRWCFTTHIGDTRAYLFRDEKLVQLTEDHTLSKHYQRFGLFESEAEFENFPYHNVLVRAFLGVSEQSQATGRALRIREGDRFVVCSDGLYKELEISVMEEILDMNPSASRAAEELLAAVMETEARDNIAITVINVTGPRHDEDPLEERRDFGELRSMVQHPSELSWQGLVRYFNQPLSDSASRELLHYAKQHIKRWPERIRRPTPLRWLLEDMWKVHERPELALCDTLSVPAGYLLDVEELRALYTHSSLQPLLHLHPLKQRNRPIQSLLKQLVVFGELAQRLCQSFWVLALRRILQRRKCLLHLRAHNRFHQLAQLGHFLQELFRRQSRFLHGRHCCIDLSRQFFDRLCPFGFFLQR